jgi:hypothetical protein
MPERQLAGNLRPLGNRGVVFTSLPLQTWYVGVRSARVTNARLNRATLLPQRVVG